MKNNSRGGRSDGPMSPASGTKFTGKDPSLPKPAKFQGNQSGTGPRKKSTPND